MDWYTGSWLLDHASARVAVLRDLHNAVVACDDTIYVLGDACVTLESLDLLPGFEGRKILLRGKAEERFTDHRLLTHFERVVPYAEPVPVMCGSYPVLASYAPVSTNSRHFNVVGCFAATPGRIGYELFNAACGHNSGRPVPASLIAANVLASSFYDAIEIDEIEESWV